MPRKHLIAHATNKKQQTQAKIWLKLAKEIRAAAKVGGTNIEANYRLKAAVEKAIQNNLSRESINKNILGAKKDPSNLSLLTYECYGPNGSQFIISALTDNINRTTSNLRGYLGKINGKIAVSNSVKTFFDQKGYFILAKNQATTEDTILECLIDMQDLDIKEYDDNFEIYVNPISYSKSKELLEKKGFIIYESEIKLVNMNKVDISDQKTLDKIEIFLNTCDNDDDIQWVVHNLV